MQYRDDYKFHHLKITKKEAEEWKIPILSAEPHVIPKQGVHFEDFLNPANSHVITGRRSMPGKSSLTSLPRPSTASFSKLNIERRSVPALFAMQPNSSDSVKRTSLKKFRQKFPSKNEM